MSIDHVLKLYSETIRSSYLHYGFWDDPDSIDLETITLQIIKDAQVRYIEHLASFIPDSVSSILDVGCGIGGNTEFLLKNGYNVEALSPDDYQKNTIITKFDNKVPFYHCKFENFTAQKKYDLILESESACYIKMDEGFKKGRQALNDGGYLLASDYFVHFKDTSKNIHLKSSHNMNQYLSFAQSNGYKLIREYDQTENTMPTLDYAKYFVERFLNPTVEYGINSANKNFPKISKLIGRIISSKFQKKRDQLNLIDSKQFRKYRKYMIYLFQKIDV
jgi:MPBQ/MSBQ methyltransferase